MKAEPGASGRRDRAAMVRLCAISDLESAERGLIVERFGRLARLARPGTVAFQLRDTGRSARERFELGRALHELAGPEGQLLFANDRLDLALLLDADGVHLGERSLETTDARRLLRESVLISRACHDPEAVANVDADLILLSPVLAQRKGRPPLGLGGVGRAAERLRAAESSAVLMALGGVDADNAGRCLSAGAAGVAVVGAALGEGARLEALLERLELLR